MADSKVSDFSAATSVNPTDVLYLIQGSNDRKISMSTLLANLPNSLTKFSGVVALAMNGAQTLVGSGAIQTTQTLTLISNTGTVGSLTINNGSFEGQLKLIMFTGGSANSTLTSNIKATNIVFNKPGHTALLVWFNNIWWIIGGTAIVTV
jgi:hypothetical protein